MSARVDPFELVWRAVRDEFVRREFTPSQRAAWGQSDDALVASLGGPEVVAGTLRRARDSITVARAFGSIGPESTVMGVTMMVRAALEAGRDRAQAALARHPS